MRIPLPSGDGLKWVAAGCALVATASAEYEIARAIGMNEWVAAAVPGALDAYVLRALRAHREVLTAVLAMIGVNAASHLLTAGLLPLDWKLVTAVSAIAPLVLWRVHALGTPGEWRERKLWEPSTAEASEHAGTVSVPAVPPLPVRVPGASEPPSTDTCPYCDTPGVLMSEHVNVCARWASTPGTLDICPCVHWDESTDECMCSHGCPIPCSEADDPSTVHKSPSTFDEHARDAVSLASTPDHEPFPYEWDERASTPVLRLVPDLANEHASTPAPDFTKRQPMTFTGTSTDQEHVSTGVLHPSDTVFLERARVLAGQMKRVPGVNDFKRELNVGTPRAQRLVAALTIEHARAQEGGTP